MSKNQKATLTLIIKEVGSAALTGVKSGLSAIGGAAKMVVGGLVAIGAAAIATAKQFGEFEEVRQSFNRLAESQGKNARDMLANMRKVTQGTISDLKLMEAANQSMLLGLPVDKVAEMFRIAKTAADATGRSIDETMNMLQRGLSRGSEQMLRQIGITIDAERAYSEYAASVGMSVKSLTDADKRQVLFNAAMKEGAKLAGDSADGNLSLADSMEAFAAKTENASILIGQAAAPAVTFFIGKVNEMFDAMNSGVNQDLLQDFFKETAKIITVVWNVVELVGQSIGTVVGGIANTISNLMSGKFVGAGAPLVQAFDTVMEDIKSHAEKTGADLDALDAAYSSAKIARVQEEEAAKASIRETAHQQKKEFNQAAWDEEQALNFERQASELDMIGANEAQKLAFVQKSLDDQLKAATTMAQKKKIWQAKEDVLEMQRAQKLKEFEEAEQQKKIANLQQTLGTISSLQSSNNKTLVAIGKAAAIANITISTAQGIGVAWSMGPILGPALAGLVAVAGAAQMAQVAGVKFAEGGIVPASMGGTQAIIGEAGRSEAVIPLPDDFNPDQGLGGGSTTIVFNGPIMGDRSQAREFAVMLDQELYKLRKSNESLSFDERIV